MEPLVTVALAVHNGGRFLRDALESLRTQTHRHLEIMVIDDGSTDGSARLVEKVAAKDSRIRLIRGVRQGLARSLNAIITEARGEFIARMDADDICDPRRIALQIDHLRAHPRCLAVGGQVVRIDDRGHPLERLEFPTSTAEIEAMLFRAEWAICHPTVVMRAAALRQVGGYREEFPQSQDYDLWLRLLDIGELANLPDFILRYRHHAGSTTSTKTREQIALARRALEEAHARRELPMPAGGVPEFSASAGKGEHPLALAERALRSGFPRTAKRFAARAVLCGPGRRKAARLLARLLLRP